MVSQPKNQHSNRTLIVPQQAVDLLIQEHSLHPNNPYLFPSPTTGTMYSPETVARIHKRILRDAGLEDCRFHDLRHTFATVALQNGVDIKTLSGMLGHYSSGFTLDTYTHVTRKMQEEAAEKMGQFMEMKLWCGIVLSAIRLKCSPSQGQNHLTHCGSIPAGCSPVEMYS